MKILTMLMPKKLLDLNSNEKVMETSSALYYWDHHTLVHTVAKPTEAQDTAFVYL